MNIAIFGFGYVGVATAYIFRRQNEIYGYDPKYCKSLDCKKVREADIIFLCVETPGNSEGHLDTGPLYIAYRTAREINLKAAIVIRSTVPVGYCDWLKDKKVFYNPEFLTEKNFLNDIENPDRVFLGGDIFTPEIMMLYTSVFAATTLILGSYVDAEIVKLGSNAFLAARIALINEISRICKARKADIRTVACAIGLDSRIGSKYLEPSNGYGGSCLPKDVRELGHTIKDLPLIKAISESNDLHKTLIK